MKFTSFLLPLVLFISLIYLVNCNVYNITTPANSTAIPTAKSVAPPIAQNSTFVSIARNSTSPVSPPTAKSVAPSIARNSTSPVAKSVTIPIGKNSTKVVSSAHVIYFSGLILLMAIFS